MLNLFYIICIIQWNHSAPLLKYYFYAFSWNILEYYVHKLILLNIVSSGTNLKLFACIANISIVKFMIQIVCYELLGFSFYFPEQLFNFRRLEIEN